MGRHNEGDGERLILSRPRLKVNTAFPPICCYHDLVGVAWIGW